MQRNSPVLLVTILLGVLALGATAFFLLGPKSGPAPVAQAAGPTPTPKPVERWVASRDIPPRTLISSQMMRRDFASGAVPEGAITSLDDVRGQITKEPIGAGETVLLSSLTSRLQRKVPANISIPTGFRGVAIWVDPSQTAAGLVDVGDRIDVIATHKLTNTVTPTQRVVGAITFTAGRTIAQNLLVLGVDESIKAIAPTPTPVPGAAGGPPPPPPTPAPPTSGGPTRTRVLVAATPDVAARLVAANDQGLLNVIIRNPQDGDAGLVPEAREYPSRVVVIAPPTNAGSGSGGSSRSSRGNGERELPYVGSIPPRPQATQVPPMPMPYPKGPEMGGPDMGAPDAPSTKEITVIRGTEKTRVIVPQR